MLFHPFGTIKKKRKKIVDTTVLFYDKTFRRPESEWSRSRNRYLQVSESALEMIKFIDSVASSLSAACLLRVNQEI